MSFDHFRDWLGLIIVLWNCGLTAVIWLRKPGQDATRAVQSLRADVDGKFEGQNKTIAEIQAHMAHMPSNEDLAELAGTVREVAERTAGLTRNMDTVRLSLNRIEDFLLRGTRS